MDLSGTEFFGLALTSGIVAGVANQCARFLHDWIARRFQADEQEKQLAQQSLIQRRDLEHQAQRQERDIAHQRQVRAEDAFYAARDALLANAVDTYAWIQWSWSSDFGAEVDYYPISLNKPDTHTAGDAITALNEIAGKHPKKGVREYAKAIADSIDGIVNMPEPDGSADPGVEDYSYWSRRTEQLIDAMHDPDYQPQTVEKVVRRGRN